MGGPTVRIDDAGVRILTDPTLVEPRTYGSEVTCDVGFTLVETDSPAPASEQLGAIDVVPASHEHVDNLDSNGHALAARVGHGFTAEVVAGVVTWGA